MIAFITNYDDCTLSNFNVVNDIIPNTFHYLFGDTATRANLLNELMAHQENPVFVLTHGNSNSFYDNTDTTAIGIDDIGHFQNRKVFVYACFTSNSLGRQSSNNNCIYWGYTGAVVPLVDSGEYAGIFRNIFTYILNEFSLVDTREAILAVVGELYEMCNRANVGIDEICEHNPESNSLDSYTCLFHIWDRLRVYVRNQDELIRHPDAQTGDIYEYI